MQGNIPSTLCKLPYLDSLYLSISSWGGLIPECFGNITSIRYLHLYSSILKGSIPGSLCNLLSLQDIDLSDNNLEGLIPWCLGNISSLRYIDLSSNKLEGSIPGSLCNLQPSLEVLILSNNSLHGPIPQCLGKLKFLTTLIVFKNQLGGKLAPTPAPAISNDTDQTSLIYGIETWLCSLRSLQFLDLSDNNLHGPLPQCLVNFSKELTVINLARNHFQGFIPGVFINGNILEYLNLNDNQLGGPLPRGLRNCNNLKFLDLGNNKLRDSFPHWLGALSNLRVFVLRSNHFYGETCTSNTTFPFPKLHIFDISHNEFNGPLPRYYMENFEAMQRENDDERLSFYEASISLVWKGVELQVVHYNICTSLDLSRNYFHGEIPKSLGRLVLIRFLNLSHNQLTGYIPPSLGNLTILEALDLSSNKLVGEIPEQLSKSLTFLAVLNLSYNNLSGPIPNGPQFDTFDNNSYIGNTALCGFPLTLKCQDRGDGKAPVAEDSQNLRSGFGWRSVVIGYSCGMPFGIFIGYLIFKYGKPRWLIRCVIVAVFGL
ncbi:receptor-like protein 9DC3 [Ipomoea triloba]|uniref:receptor-like protein 9DC3 n=1 Tax=Ipomoea triloba TaxID=35885 RepID=UPI00125D5969|nr:receptor-like protein 9DC3 [Ipomoea triloba]